MIIVSLRREGTARRPKLKRERACGARLTGARSIHGRRIDFPAVSSRRCSPPARNPDLHRQQCLLEAARETLLERSEGVPFGRLLAPSSPIPALVFQAQLVHRLAQRAHFLNERLDLGLEGAAQGGARGEPQGGGEGASPRPAESCPPRIGAMGTAREQRRGGTPAGGWIPPGLGSPRKAPVPLQPSPAEPHAGGEFPLSLGPSPSADWCRIPETIIFVAVGRAQLPLPNGSDAPPCDATPRAPSAPRPATAAPADGGALSSAGRSTGMM